MQTTLAALLFTVITLNGVPAMTQEFRIETEVYSGGSKEPVSENMTLFANNKVYDFLFDPEDMSSISEIVIFDCEQQHFILLNVNRKLKLEIKSQELSHMLAALQASTLWQEKFPFLLKPTFDESFDKETDWLTLSSEQMSYRVRGMDLKAQNRSEEFESALPMYLTFIDSYARLNASDPSKLPPFARLKLNEAIARHKLMPETVEMTLKQGNGLFSKKITATSRHSIVWQLSKQDRTRIQLSDKYRAQFDAVRIAEYRDFSSPAAVSR